MIGREAKWSVIAGYSMHLWNLGREEFEPGRRESLDLGRGFLEEDAAPQDRGGPRSTVRTAANDSDLRLQKTRDQFQVTVTLCAIGAGPGPGPARALGWGCGPRRGRRRLTPQSTAPGPPVRQTVAEA